MKQEYWIVEPNKDRSLDSWCCPVKDDPEGRESLNYAKEVLEYLWDASESLGDLDITVRIRMYRKELHDEDVDYGDR